MGNFVWIYRGIKKEVPKQLASMMEEHGFRAVCLCKEIVLQMESQLIHKEISFLELLLDERYLENGIVIDNELLRNVGNINKRLLAKTDYELALRVAECEPIYAVTYEMECPKEAIQMESIEEGFFTDAYVIGRYFTRLSEAGIGEQVLKAAIEETALCQNPLVAQMLLEEMISHGAEYQRIYRATQPILIYLGVTYCYNILNVFAKELANALEAFGERVVFYDDEKHDIREMSRLVKQQYKASIGFQSWIMSIQMGESREYVQNLIGGPKYNFVVDHPIWLKEQLEHIPNNYYVLTHDRDYQQFIRRNFKGVKDVHLLPPGGRQMHGELESTEKDITTALKQKDVVFLGTYRDYRDKLQEIRAWEPWVRHFAARYLGNLKKSLNSSSEEVFQKTLEELGMELEQKNYLNFFYKMAPVIQAIMYYYREQVVRTILSAGLELHVYGVSWESSPFAKEEGLHIHPEVAGEQGIEELTTAKISLNIMAWHKDGFTERIADSMFAGAVVVSDWSRQLEEFYSEETVLYKLEELEELPQILKELLLDEEKRQQIVRKARLRAEKELTWKVRAEKLLYLIEDAEG